MRKRENCKEKKKNQNTFRCNIILLFREETKESTYLDLTFSHSFLKKKSKEICNVYKKKVKRTKNNKRNPPVQTHMHTKGKQNLNVSRDFKRKNKTVTQSSSFGTIGAEIILFAKMRQRRPVNLISGCEIFRFLASSQQG